MYGPKIKSIGIIYKLQKNTYTSNYTIEKIITIMVNGYLVLM